MLICKVSLLTIILLGDLALTACTITKQATNSNITQCSAHQQKVHTLNQYKARGSFVYLFGKKRIYARFFLQQYSPEYYSLLLTNPLGNIELGINVRPNLVQLTDHRGQVYFDNNPEKIIYRLSGIVIPLNNLREWILGLPGNCNEFILDNQGRLSKLTYKRGSLSWDVDYQEYSNTIIPSLPIRLILKQNNQYIKLTIDNWSFK